MDSNKVVVSANGELVVAAARRLLARVRELSHERLHIQDDTSLGVDDYQRLTPSNLTLTRAGVLWGYRCFNTKP